MTSPSSKLHLTSELWNTLRKGMLELQTCPAWVTEVASREFEEVKQLPARLSGLSAGKPHILSCDKRTYLVAFEKVRYGSDSSELEKLRKKKVEALKQHPCEQIIELQLAHHDGLFRAIFAGDSHEVIHTEILPSYFVQIPKWRQVLSIWRGILVVATVLVVIAYFTTPSIGGACVLFAASFAVLVTSLFVFGKSHILESGLLVSVAALLAGLLMRVWWTP